MPEAAPANAPAHGGDIQCRVTTWYYRRMGLMAGVLAFFGLYFLYDGKYGYPADNVIADKKAWFDETLTKGFENARTAGTLEAWLENARKQGWPTGKDGQPPRWVSYAAEQGWPEKPKRHSQADIDGQFWWGGGSLVIALAVAGLMLMNRNKVLTGAQDHLISPSGERVDFANITRADKRAWDQKGLAYLWHRPSPGAKERRVVIDDLKFQGADRVLQRALANFRGEVLEKKPASSNGQAASASTEV